MAYGPGRRLQFPRGRPRRLRLVATAGSAAGRSRARSTPISIPIAASTARAKRVHLTALVRDDKARRGRRLAADLAPVAAGRGRGRPPPADRRQARRPTHETYALARDARIGTWRVELKLDPKAPAIGSVEFRVEDFVPPQLKLELSAADQPIRPGEPFPVAVTGELLLRRAGGRARGRGAGDDRARRQPFPSEPGFQFGLVDEEFCRQQPRISTRRRPTTHGKSSVTLDLTDLPDLTKPLAATIRVSVFEPSGRAGQRNPDPADPHARRWRSACARRRATTRSPRASRRTSTSSRSTPTASASPRRACAGNCCARAGNMTGIRSTASWRHRVQVRDQPLETGDARYRRRRAGDAVADAAGRALSLGGRRTARAARNRACAFMSAGGSRRPCRMFPTSSPRRSTRRATSRATPPSCSIKAPFAGEAELAIASDRMLALRSVTLPQDGHDGRDPGRCRLGQRGLRAGQRLSPAERRHAGTRQGTPRGPGRAVGVAWLGIDPARARWQSRSPRPMSRGRAGPIDIGGQGRRARAGRRGLCDPRRGRRGGVEADRFRQPGAGDILFRQAPARGRTARSLRPADRSGAPAVSACCAAAATSSPSARSPASPTRAAASSRSIRGSCGSMATAPRRCISTSPISRASSG